MVNTFIFGHKNPDTDTIASALVMEDLQKELGNDVQAARLGDVSDETQFALDYFKVQAPALLETPLKDKDVILVDHNEFQQSADDISDATITMVVDHHRISNFETAAPLYYRAEPVGCTTTILKKMYEENGVEIKPEIAGLMISAIISDTLLFKSPTCTEQDKQACEALAKIANVDLNEYGLEMLKAGASVKGKSPEFLLNMDAKSFNMGDKVVRIAQVNTVDVNEVLEIQEDVENEINAIIAKEQYDLFVFVITDILNSDSTAIALGKEQQVVTKAFNTELNGNVAVLPGVVSRKKQVVPPIDELLGK
ncbi:manganese-dependent inorganic pyrophosphatase [Mammaliicoccus sciuri]|uniref:Probable manganese-dependent inorganic pyrophosphatase n=1 Tax=Mammaliicoccus sciuri TaxID=1296 RepID=A0ABT7I0Z1_MAMSC|nr:MULTISPECIES: manganese-dependent inorganic pyrophosphatase [Mammaliicoccus]MCJ0915501.1 manganese-dependent inorganic pyrophosphatase [Mammaliicoccus sciuri]MCJ0920249.1 manganese-dependent inorganic pyrophosphatase [Mammaliicoccus sciuri]MCJ0943997.1 manganese-dependent inorganic pyrophosphatase [Mammaliicoccus sciuri]MCJ0957995.1 manganese-dependent inorganic pyrophosphatase [Mammaliicoccus sciuri]MCJ0962983.1 manganese-dependent inorganic pyrophosphatase [Mammaliicoccus sciuri]